MGALGSCNVLLDLVVARKQVTWVALPEYMGILFVAAMVWFNLVELQARFSASSLKD